MTVQDYFVVGPRVAMALSAEIAAVDAGREYDLSHGFWSRPLFDRRARKKAVNKARKAARAAWRNAHGDVPQIKG